MTLTKSNFKNHLKIFLKSALIICRKEISENPDIYAKEVRRPAFSGDTFTDVKIEEGMDFEKLLYTLHDKTRNHPNFGSLQVTVMDVLEGRARLLEKKTKCMLDVDLKQTDDSPLFDFVRIYLERYGLDFETESFKKTSQNFHQYLDGDYFSYHYLTPLYNLHGGFEKIHLSEDLWIRRITEDEFSKILNIKNMPEKEIPTYQRRLKFVIVCRMIRKKGSDFPQTALENFENVANALKVFGDDNSEFGSIYWISSENWDVEGLKLIEQGHERIISSSVYSLDEREAVRFSRFYEDLSCKLYNSKNSEFLKSAIRRYGMGFHHRSHVDKIVDCVISLESLIVEGAGESTLKLAHRMSSLLGESDVERLEIWKFMKEAYKFRSGILHESKSRRFKINSHALDLKVVSDKLGRYTRQSIQRMILLLNRYETQKEIIDELDKSMYDRGNLKKLQQCWKNL